MAYFIKSGFWDKSIRAPKEWLNLDQIIQQISLDSSTNIVVNNTISSKNSTLTTSSPSLTIDISYSGDDMTLELILNNTASTLVFPENSLCVSEGIATGDNTLSLSGSSGDKYIIGIKFINNTYYIVSKNFGQ